MLSSAKATPLLMKIGELASLSGLSVDTDSAQHRLIAQRLLGAVEYHGIVF